MKKLFVDTNILLDVILDRECADVSKSVLDLSQDEFSFHVSTLTMANIAYILRKVAKGNDLYTLLDMIADSVWVDSLSALNFYEALDLKASDFEDALQYFCAKENGCECIITNNQKDYTYSEIPVMSPAEFIGQI